ncbi:MAG: YceD family protein [Oculatellaceae cyanobacterium Prado106]|jgi:uncharacterized protein|nr:YceD family protein [Oculatellaceae cyanobacterium Prado106]
MQPIYIPQLTKAPEQTWKLTVDEYLPDLETLTPAQGQLQVTHQGNYLEVKAKAEAIMTLTCDRCLQQYNHRLTVNTSELIWLQEPIDEEDLPLEREVSLDELVETLDPQSHFQPDAWLYEQFCLIIPQRQLCDRNCPGIEVQDNPQQTSSPGSEQKRDRRWSSLEALRSNLPN